MMFRAAPRPWYGKLSEIVNNLPVEALSAAAEMNDRQ
jgi:hypothetical protein